MCFNACFLSLFFFLVVRPKHSWLPSVYFFSPVHVRPGFLFFWGNNQKKKVFFFLFLFLLWPELSSKSDTTVTKTVFSFFFLWAKSRLLFILIVNLCGPILFSCEKPNQTKKKVEKHFFFSPTWPLSASSWYRWRISVRMYIWFFFSPLCAFLSISSSLTLRVFFFLWSRKAIVSLGSNTGLILLVIILVLAVSFFFALVVDYPLKMFFFFFWPHAFLTLFHYFKRYICSFTQRIFPWYYADITRISSRLLFFSCLMLNSFFFFLKRLNPLHRCNTCLFFFFFLLTGVQPRIA